MRTVFKAHGLGNDYLVWEEGTPLDEATAIALCHRHTGPGGDGVLEPFSSERADLGIRIWNPDGSVAEKSGNGLRIASWWWHHERGGPATHTVDTGFDVVRSEVDGHQVTVQMGHATFDPAAIPTREPVAERAVTLGDDEVVVTAVGTGNPHAVCFRDDDLDALPWRRWGAALEVHPLFPHRTNVQFARVLGPHRVAIRIWERGAGETSASGSSSCGVVAAGVRTGRLQPGRTEVVMPGGRLFVTCSPAYELVLEGPVAAVGRTTLHPAWGATS
jgi:diaminopimelate epimerase